jgi:hypothetical protein
LQYPSQSLDELPLPAPDNEVSTTKPPTVEEQIKQIENSDIPAERKAAMIKSVHKSATPCKVEQQINCLKHLRV